MKLFSYLYQCIVIFLLASASILSQMTTNQSGKIDRDFGVNGFATIIVGDRSGGIMLDDGAALVAATMNFAYPNTGIALSKQLANGSIDGSFGQNGISRVQLPRYAAPNTIAVQPDGKILVGGLMTPQSLSNGWDFLLVRFLATGQLDQSFGDSGYITIDIPSDPNNYNDFTNDTVGSIIVQKDGAILVSGTSDQKLAVTSQNCVKAILVKLKIDGTLDLSFGNKGISSKTMLLGEGSIGGSSPLRLKTLQSGKLIGGMTVFKGLSAQPNSSQPAILLGYLSDGSLDKTFGEGGIVDLTVDTTSNLNWRLYDFAELSDHKLFVLTSGAFNRLNPDGTFDETFGNHGIVRGTNNALFSFTVLSDGSVIATGSSGRNTQFGYKSVGEIRHYFTDGSVDARFGVSGRSYIETPGYDTFLGSIQQTSSTKITIFGVRNLGFGWQVFRSKVFLKRKL